MILNCSTLAYAINGRALPSFPGTLYMCILRPLSAVCEFIRIAEITAMHSFCTYCSVLLPTSIPIPCVSYNITGMI